MMASLLLSLSLLGAPAFATTEASLQQEYQTFLQGKGYTTTVDSDGDIRFQHTHNQYTLNLFVETNEQDPTFFRMAVYNIWPIESAAERVKVLEACNVVNDALKVVKMYVTNDNVWIAIELYSPNVTDYRAIFDRSMRTIDDAVDRFVAAMK